MTVTAALIFFSNKLIEYDIWMCSKHKLANTFKNLAKQS